LNLGLEVAFLCLMGDSRESFPVSTLAAMPAGLKRYYGQGRLHHWTGAMQDGAKPQRGTR